MINPNRTYDILGTIVSADHMTSLTVFKIETKHGTFDYTVFGNNPNSELTNGTKLKCSLKYSISLNNYFVYHVESNRLTLVG